MANTRFNHGTLAAEVVTTVTLDSTYERVEVMVRTTATNIFFTVDGTTPTVGGGNCWVVPGVIGAFRVVAAPPGEEGDGTAPPAPPTILMVSSGAPEYSVSGID